VTAAVERVLVVIPTYNEATTLPGIVARVRAATPAADVLVVDDGSPDGTGRVAEGLAAADPQVRVLHRVSKDGLGAAYLAGFAQGLAAGYDALVELDADGSHPPERLPAMLAALADADLVIGSRYVPGGRVEDWPRHRLFLSRGGNTYTRLWLGLPVHDATAGYRVYRASALRSLDLDGVESQGYCFQVDLTRRAVRAGLRVREVPITFVERAVGESKMSSAIVREALWRVTRWGFDDRLRGARRSAGTSRRS
jgi:dolichol-phosphate mannosyltransferase